MADKTPLSISQRSTKMSKRKDEDEDSYEHKVEKRIFKDKALKADFGMAYRDSFKALPYLEHVAPDTSSLGKGTRMPGLVKVAPPETEVDPAATTATIKATPDSTPVDSTHMEYRSMRNYFADIEKAFNSRQLDTIPEIPYREPLSKENIAKLNIKHKDGYRMLDSTHDQASDAEDEAEDDKTTKWDTETHVGDRDFNTINPWQTNAPNDMEYKAFEVLRSQFKKVGIKKRTRADVEQAQAQAEAEDETDVRDSSEILPLGDMFQAHLTPGTCLKTQTFHLEGAMLTPKSRRRVNAIVRVPKSTKKLPDRQPSHCL